MATTTGIWSLPNEILAHMLSYLARPCLSESKLYDMPSIDMLNSADRPLKNATLVCKLWRAMLLPRLFQHVQWRLGTWELLSMRHDPAPIPVLHFLRDGGLAKCVQSMTLVVFEDVGPGSVLETGHFGLAMRRDRAVYTEDSNWLWRAIFRDVDPLRFTLIASPRILAALMARMIFVRDVWAFASAANILSLSRPDTQDATPPSSTGDGGAGSSPAIVTPPHGSSPQPPPASAPDRPDCDLLTLRPWRTALFNEGTSALLLAGHNQIYHRHPPSILSALVGGDQRPNDVPLLPPTVRDLSYVAIFPLSPHFITLIDHIPSLDRLYIQLVPRNDMLRDPLLMRGVDANDLWVERNEIYSMLMRKIFGPGSPRKQWRELKVFESGDAADKDAWILAVEYVRLSIYRGWRVESEGVFVRESAVEMDGDSPRQLSRLAFNGVTNLPLSSMWLYRNSLPQEPES